MKQYFLLIICFLIAGGSYGQFQGIKGNWVSDKNEMLSIQDTLNSNNYITNSNWRNNNFYLEILNDTISFQLRYYTSADDFEKLIIDPYDFKILELTDSTLTVNPITKFSKNFMASDDPILFTKQEYISNPTFYFEKLIFRTSTCYGSCPELNLRITADKKLEFNAIYYDNTGYLKNEKKSGNFIAKISAETYNKLIELLIEAKISTFNIIPGPMDLCCDGAIKTIITYHNGKRNYIKTMHHPRILRELIFYLYNLPQKVNLKRTEKKFTFEK